MTEGIIDVVRTVQTTAATHQSFPYSWFIELLFLIHSHYKTLPLSLLFTIQSFNLRKCLYPCEIFHFLKVS